MLNLGQTQVSGDLASITPLTKLQKLHELGRPSASAAFPLCHIQHSELAAAFHRYKGRVVFGGNQIRDEQGVLAVFQEQGASASSMTAAKLLDALSRMPGYDGGNADASKAYT